jgi:hypothetical protein
MSEGRTRTTTTTTWLHTLLEQYKIPKINYEGIFVLLASELELAEKCEELEEFLASFMWLSASQVEGFLRTALEVLEVKGLESLLNPASHSQELLPPPPSKKKSGKHVKSNHQIASLAAAAAAAQPVNSSRIEDDLEEAVLQHWEGVSDDRLDAADPYEQELDVYSTLTPFALVQTIFSNMTQDQIEGVLEQHHYNIEDTMDSLFGSEIMDDAELPRGGGKSKQVCRHFLLGQCYRSDCWYSHDPEVVLCKFWLKGRCYKGDGCEFSHGQALDQITMSKTGLTGTSSSQAPPKLEEFPALGGPTKKKFDFLAPSSTYNTALKKKPVVDKLTAQLNAVSITNQSLNSIKSVDAGWVSTGDTLSNSYLDYRKEAIEAALNRNRLFQQYV